MEWRGNDIRGQIRLEEEMWTIINNTLKGSAFASWIFTSQIKGRGPWDRAKRKDEGWASWEGRSWQQQSKASHCPVTWLGQERCAGWSCSRGILPGCIPGPHFVEKGAWVSSPGYPQSLCLPPQLGGKLLSASSHNFRSGHPHVWEWSLRGRWFQLLFCFQVPSYRVVLVVKNVSANARVIRDLDLIPGSGRYQEKGMATHSSILAWRTHGRRSLVGYSPWDRRVSHDWSDLARLYESSISQTPRSNWESRLVGKIHVHLQTCTAWGGSFYF